MNLKLYAITREPDLNIGTIESGRFTIVAVSDKIGMHAVGISRKADEDKANPKVGIQTAKGRALKALLLKRQGKKIRNAFMG